MTSTRDTETLVHNEELPEASYFAEVRSNVGGINADVTDVTANVTDGTSDVADVTSDIKDNDVKDQEDKPGGTKIRQNIVELSNSEAHGGNANNNLQKVEYETIPVCYSSMYGVYVIRKPVVRTQDGTRVIQTPHTGEGGLDERPLRAKDIRFVKIASIIAMIIFFPLGIPAYWFILKAAEDFARVSESDSFMDKAKKKVKKSERLVLFAIVVGVLTYILIIAIVQRNKNGWHEHPNTLHWTH